jgi:hypothetical protein
VKNLCINERRAALLSLILRDEKPTDKSLCSETCLEWNKKGLKFFRCRQAPFYKGTLNLDDRVSRSPEL